MEYYADISIIPQRFPYWQMAIAFARYMLIAVEQRESEDYRSCGELFMLLYQELQDITLIKSLALIVALFKKGMT